MADDVTLTNLVPKLNLRIKQGSTYGPNTLTFTGEDITSWIFRGQARKTADSPTVAAPVTATIVDGPNGVVQWSFLATHTAAMTCHPSDVDHEDSTYVWDFEAEKPDGTVISIHDGQLNLWREVTRP